MISVSYPSEKESASITRRLQNIEEFIDFSLAPPVPPPPLPVPSTSISPVEAKLRAKEERNMKKEARKREKKLKRQKMRERAGIGAGGKDPHRKKRMTQTHSDDEEEAAEKTDFKYLPNDEDFPDIRKFNEVTPSPQTKRGGESLYAAALAAVRRDDHQSGSRRYRQERGEGEDCNAETDSNDDDEGEEGESDYDEEDDSQGSSVSELDSEEEQEPEPVKEGESHVSQNVTSAVLEDDLDDGDDVIVFQPLFSQQQPSPIERPSPSHSQPVITPPRSVSEKSQETGGIDLDSLAYLQALHQKNTQQGGWLHDSDQPASLSFDNSASGHHPFQMGEHASSEYDYWGHGHGDDGAAYPSPSSNLMRSQLGYHHSHHEEPNTSIFANDDISRGDPSTRRGGGEGEYSWSNHLSFSSSASNDVAPPPGFMDFPPSGPSGRHYQMYSTAANFLPTSLRGELPPQPPASSIFSMLYGSTDPDHQRDAAWRHPGQGGYHDGT
jgi:hypothetical protein